MTAFILQRAASCQINKVANQTPVHHNVHHKRVFCSAAERPEQGVGVKSVVIRPTVVTKQAGVVPQPAPIEHSSTFLLAERRQLEAEDEGASLARVQATPEPFTGNAVEWVLKKADQSLDEIEENPPLYAKALFDVSTGPIGAATAEGVRSAAKVTVKLGTEAVKAAAPVGKWVLQQSAKAAVSAIKTALTAEKKNRKSS